MKKRSVGHSGRVWRKLRSDSKLAGLSQEVRQQLAAILQKGCSLTAASQWLETEHCVSMSETSISQYYHTHVLADQWKRNEAIAHVLADCKTEAVSDAAHKAIAQKAYTLATANDCDPKLLTAMYKMFLSSEASRQDARKIALLERKAAQADEARANLEKRITEGGLSPEALALAEEQLKLL